MGIANIVNTAGGGGGSSEIITNLVNSVDGAGLRLANQGYISCADVSANRFGTNDFSVEFVLSQETSAINADIFISNLNGSNQAVDAAVIRWDVIQNDNIQLVFTNSGAAETAYNFGYDPAPDLNEPTHYLVSADRSGNAVLYRNGAEIASVSIAASGSANVGNSGQPTVIGSPVNNFGVKGNVYRFRTYSKALSSDEAKNVFDRADVPTALVSNLLLDLDCAYANPTQSTVIQDRGPNNQDGTLNGTITQTNVIKQLNSTSARIGTTAATPADGTVHIGDSTTTPLTGADDLIIARGSNDAGVTIRTASTATGQICFADGNTGNEQYRGFIGYAHGTDKLNLGSGGSTRLTIDSSGTATISKPQQTTTGTPFSGAALKLLPPSGGTTNTTGVSSIALSTSVTDNYGFLISGHRAGTDGTPTLRVSSHNNSNTGTEVLTIDSTGQTSFAGHAVPATNFGHDLGTSSLKWSNVYAFQGNFQNGITFTQTNTTATGATATGTTLDHYEEGTWTPSLSPGGGTFTTLTYTTQRGKYIRVGSQVWVGFEITVNAFTIGSGASYVVLNGLPFDRGAAEDQYGSGTVTQYSGWTNNAPVTLPRLNAGSCILRYATSSVDVANVPPANITAGCVMNGFMVYSV